MLKTKECKKVTFLWNEYVYIHLNLKQLTKIFWLILYII